MPGDSCTPLPPLTLALTRDLQHLALIVRRLHPHSYVIIAKYVASQDNGMNIPYMGPAERVLESYHTPSVIASSSAFLRYEPVYGVKVPVLDADDIYLAFNPFELIRSNTYFSNEHSSQLPEPLADLMLRGCAYPTGSTALLAATELSDIDVVADLSNGCLGYVCNTFEELDKKTVIDDNYIVSEASRRMLATVEAKRLLPGWQHFRYRGRRVSVTVVTRSLRERVETRVFRLAPLHRARARIHVEPCQLSVGDYPAIIESREGIVLLVYDGFFVPALIHGGCFIVEGVHAEITLGGGETVDAIAVGGREALGRIRPC